MCVCMGLVGWMCVSVYWGVLVALVAVCAERAVTMCARVCVAHV